MERDLPRELAEPFEASEIEWRINRSGFTNQKPWATAIPYITSRAVQDRLDKVFGVFGWQNEIKQVSVKGFLSGISFKHDGEWITKWDGAEGNDSNGMDIVKSGSSNALKRAAVLLGIGRYLYDLEESFVQCEITDCWKHQYGNVFKHKDSGNLIAWLEPDLPPMALPHFNIDQHLQDMKAARNTADLEDSYRLAHKAARMHGNKKKLDEAVAIGKAKRAEFTSQAALRIEEDTKIINDWVTSQLKGFDLVPYETSVNTVCNSMLTDLNRRTTATMVNKDQFQNIIIKAADKRKLEIKTQSKIQLKEV